MRRTSLWFLRLSYCFTTQKSSGQWWNMITELEHVNDIWEHLISAPFLFPTHSMHLCHNQIDVSLLFCHNNKKLLSYEGMSKVCDDCEERKTRQYILKHSKVLNVVFSQCSFYVIYAERRSLILDSTEKILRYLAVKYSKAGSDTCT